MIKKRRFKLSLTCLQPLPILPKTKQWSHSNPDMKKIPDKLKPWFDARKRFKLSHAHIQMARELGLNPKKFGSLANHAQEPWKAPLPEFIDRLYFKHFGKNQPDTIRSLEQVIEDQESKKAIKKARKAGGNDPENSQVPF